MLSLPICDTFRNGDRYKIVHPSGDYSENQKRDLRNTLYSHPSNKIANKITKHIGLNTLTTDDLIKLEKVTYSYDNVFISIKGKELPIRLDLNMFPTILNSKLKEGILNQGYLRTSLSKNETRTILSKVFQDCDERLAVKLIENATEKEIKSLKQAKMGGMASMVSLFGCLIFPPEVLLVPTALGYKSACQLAKSAAYMRLRDFYGEYLCLKDPGFKLTYRFDSYHGTPGICIDVEAPLFSKDDQTIKTSFSTFNVSPHYSKEENLSMLVRSLNTKFLLIKEAAPSWGQELGNRWQDQIREITQDLVSKYQSNNPFHLDTINKRNELLKHLFPELNEVHAELFTNQILMSIPEEETGSLKVEDGRDSMIFTNIFDEDSV
ncbi:hypothetical protein HOG98_06690 [bacterium]|jgi:hypothetical protein|nr:hypothetical protein [bacterium]